MKFLSNFQKYFCDFQIKMSQYATKMTILKSIFYVYLFITMINDFNTHNNIVKINISHTYRYLMVKNWTNFKKYFCDIQGKMI